MKEIWYRIEDHLVSSGLDEFDNSLGPPRLEVSIRKFEVIKHTAKGAWLNRGIMGKRFVLAECRKKYACPSLALALESFKARKDKQARIYQAKADNARHAIDLAEYEVTGRQEHLSIQGKRIEL